MQPVGRPESSARTHRIRATGTSGAATSARCQPVGHRRGTSSGHRADRAAVRDQPDASPGDRPVRRHRLRQRAQRGDRAALAELASRVKAVLVVEMNSGQMLNDVQRLVAGKTEVAFYGRLGGVVPFPDEILAQIRRLAFEPQAANGNPRRAWLDQSDRHRFARFDRNAGDRRIRRCDAWRLSPPTRKFSDMLLFRRVFEFSDRRSHVSLRHRSLTETRRAQRHSRGPAPFASVTPAHRVAV